MKRLAFLLLPLFVVVACTADDTGANDADVVNVEVLTNRFSPASLTIKVGQTVRWTWGGGTHNVVSGSSCSDDDGRFKSGAPVGGGTFEHKFEATGSFPYHCEPHCSVGMTGEIIVE